MKRPRILCFGDSNTWGYVPASQAERYEWGKRWPGVMQQQLGEGFVVIEEALNGRTTVWDDPMKPDRNGSRHLPVVLESHTPIDLVIIALGANDLKHHFHLTAIDVALGLQTLAGIVQQSCAGRLEASGSRSSPEVLLLSPAEQVQAIQPFGHKFDGAVERSAGMGKAVAEVAKESGCLFFDAAEVVETPATDGIHLDEQGHRNLGAAVAEFLSASLGPRR